MTHASFFQEMAKKIGCKASDIFLAKGENVVHEMFYSMVREVRDEVKIMIFLHERTCAAYHCILLFMLNSDLLCLFSHSSVPLCYSFVCSR